MPSGFHQREVSPQAGVVAPAPKVTLLAGIGEKNRTVNYRYTANYWPAYPSDVNSITITPLTFKLGGVMVIELTPLNVLANWMEMTYSSLYCFTAQI